MLTCEQIRTRAEQISKGVKITSANYRDIALQIHPQVSIRHVTPSTDFAIVREIAGLPESQEKRRASRLNTPDWSDMVVELVATWQRNEAVSRCTSAQRETAVVMVMETETEEDSDQEDVSEFVNRFDEVYGG